VVESAGIHDILTKCIGSANPHNIVRATIEALRRLKSVDQIAGKRGKQTMDILTLDPKKAAAKAARSGVELPAQPAGVTP
jgi:small subunit ribosomal protein S5